MHEAAALNWRAVVDKHHSALLDELTACLDSEMQDAVARALAAAQSQARARMEQSSIDARRSQVESLNQVLRRLRTAGSEQVLELLAESCSDYADRLVVGVFENNQVSVVAAVRVPGLNTGHESTTLRFDIGAAPAIAACIDSRDPLTALATQSEISSVLAQAFHPAPADKAYLFPLIARHSVVAMLIASGVPFAAPIELLCEAAGMTLESAPAQERKQVAAGLVQLGSAAQTGNAHAGESSTVLSWDELSVEDQRLHLQAQRMARLRVAEMRLYHQDELNSGIAAGDIYSAIEAPINSARDQFLQTFLAHSPTMVDYLHLEILRSLAHDDDSLLGYGYPGPMV